MATYDVPWRPSRGNSGTRPTRRMHASAASPPFPSSSTLGSYAGEIIVSPLLGMGVAVTYHASLERERSRDRITSGTGRETGPAEAGPGT